MNLWFLSRSEFSMGGLQDDDSKQNQKFCRNGLQRFLHVQGSVRWNIYRQTMIFQHSTSLWGGNLVDGSPSARHTEAVGGPHGGWASEHRCSGPSVIAKQKEKWWLNVQTFVQVSICIVRLLPSEVLRKITQESLISTSINTNHNRVGKSFCCSK